MIYVHVPFCRSFCTYCAFYSETGCSDINFAHYLDDLLAEMHSRSAEIASTRNFDTLYIGGGTPSVLPPRILETVVRNIPGKPVSDEFTLEVNPEDIIEKGAAYLRCLKDLGVNRISMGVQSLNPGILRWMNRRHSADGARRAFHLLREEGFRNISVDIIYGFPGFEADSLKEIAELWHPEHISAYQLSVEEGSCLYESCHSGKWQEASDEDCRRDYDTVCRELAGAGYEHYEISNWALPGKRARHNSAYWTRIPYVGLGPAAHSLCPADVRKWNSNHTSGWKSESEILSQEEITEELLILGLRTCDGVLSSLIKPEILARMLEKGALELTGTDNVRIPENRLFISDNIISDIIQ